MSEQQKDLQNTYKSVELLKTNVAKSIKGKDSVIELALATLFSGGHLLIEDAPGVGKTTLAHSIANSIGAEFSRIQFTSDLLPSDVLGVTIYNQTSHDFEFKKGPIFSNIVLADEINRATPKTQSALLEAMSEGQVSLENVTHKLPTPFMLIATQNPIEYAGTFPLPESQLDRFTMRLNIGYPNEEMEQEILKTKSSRETIQKSNNKDSAVITSSELIEIQKAVQNVTVDEDLLTYIVKLANKTRNHVDILLGVSPRASISLVSAIKALAILNGRNYALPDDIKKLAIPVLSHRIVTQSNSTSTNQGASQAVAEMILEEIINELRVPI